MALERLSPDLPGHSRPCFRPFFSGRRGGSSLGPKKAGRASLQMASRGVRTRPSLLALRNALRDGLGAHRYGGNKVVEEERCRA